MCDGWGRGVEVGGGRMSIDDVAGGREEAVKGATQRDARWGRHKIRTSVTRGSACRFSRLGCPRFAIPRKETHSDGPLQPWPTVRWWLRSVQPAGRKPVHAAGRK